MTIVDYYASKLGKSTVEIMSAVLILRTPLTAIQWDEAVLGIPKPTDEELAEIDALPDPPAPAAAVVLYRADLYRRCTDDEADAIDAALAKQPTRTRRIFESAVTFRSDDEMWALLHDAAVSLFGSKRAAELLMASA